MSNQATREDRLVSLAMSLGVEPKDLFVHVYDAAVDAAYGSLDLVSKDEALADAEREAAEANEGGLLGQIECLLEMNSVAEVESIIRRASVGR